MNYKELYNIKQKHNLWSEKHTICYFCVSDIGIGDKFRLAQRLAICLGGNISFNEIESIIEFVFDIILSDEDYSQ